MLKKSTFLIVIFLLSLFWTAQSSTQGNEWSEPTWISSEWWSSLWPIVAPDAGGQLHVFWRENTDDINFAGTPKSILYTRWDGFQWSPPVDVFVSLDLNFAIRALATIVDDAGMLHVIWSSHTVTGWRLFHSQAFSSEPIDARAWRTALVDLGEDTVYADLDSDSEGNLHLVYAMGNEVFYSMWDANENNWSNRWNLSAMAGNEIASEPQIVVDSNRTIHTSWVRHDQAGDSTELWYLASEDGSYWPPPSLIAEDNVGWLSLGVDAKDRVHLIWSRGVGTPDGRYSQLTQDLGRTWSKPVTIPDGGGLSGYTGHASMATDSNGDLHMFTSAKGPDLITAIYYSKFNEGTFLWETPQKLADDEYYGEFPQLAILNGNELHAVWMQWTNPSPIFHSQKLLDTPRIDPITYSPLPDVEQTFDDESSEGEVISYTDGVLTAGETYNFDKGQPGAVAGKNLIPIIIASLTVFLVIGFIVLARRIFKN